MSQNLSSAAVVIGTLRVKNLNQGILTEPVVQMPWPLKCHLKIVADDIFQFFFATLAPFLQVVTFVIC